MNLRSLPLPKSIFKSRAFLRRPSKRAALALALALLWLNQHASVADTEDDVQAGATDLGVNTTATYTTAPAGTTSDVTFAAGTIYANAGSFALGTALSIGTLDDLNATAITINGTALLTLTNTAGSSNVVAPANGGSSADSLFVASGGSLTINDTAGISVANTSAFDAVGTLNLGTTGISIGAGMTLSFTGAGATTVGGVIANTTGAVVVNDAGGSVTFSGANAYTGGTTLTAGTLNINNATALGTGTFVIGGGTIDNSTAGAITDSKNNALTLNGDFAFTGTSALNLGTGATTLGAAAGTSRTITINGSTLTLGGIIGNGTTANNLIKAGAGTLVLGGVNTYSGGTTINAGILQYTNIGTANGTNSGAFTLGGGTLQINQASNNFAYNPAITLTADSTFSNIGAGAINYAGTLNGGGHALNISTGAQRIFINTVAASVTNVSQFNVTAGGLGFDTSLGEGGGAAVVVSSGASLLLYNGAAANAANTFANNITLNGGTGLGGVGALDRQTGGSTGNVTLSGSVTLNSTSGIGVEANSILITGNVTGSGGLTKIGAGTLTLESAGDTYSGGTILNGTGFLEANNLASNTANTLLEFGAGSITLNGGRLDLKANGNGSNQTIITGDGMTGNNVTVGATAGIDVNQALVSGANTGNTFVLNNLSIGAFTLNVTGAQSYALRFLGTTTLTGNATFNPTSANLTLGGAVGGAFSLTKTGTGTLTLSGANTYSGGTNINGGTLSLNSAETAGTSGPLGASGTISFGGGTLQYTSNNQFDYSSRFSTAASQAYSIDTNSQNVTFATALTSSGGTLTKIGAGTLTLTGTNTYSGATTINGGTLAFAGGSALPSGSAISLGNGTLQINNDGTGSNQTISLGNSVTANGAITGTIGVGNNGGGSTGNTVAFGALSTGASGSSVNFNFTGANGYLESFSSLALVGGGGNTTTLNPTTTSVTITGNVTNPITTNPPTNKYDTLVLGGSSTGNAINGVISDNANYVSVGNGDTRITKSGTSTWTLSGANTYHGPTAVNGGTLDVTGSGTLGATTAALALGGGTLDLGTTSQTVGAVTITAAPATGNAIQNGSLTGTSYAASNTTGNAIVTANLLGTGALTKTGAGTLTLSGTNSYSGLTTIGGGVLSLGSAGALGGTSAITFSGGTLQYSAANTTDYSNIFSANGAISIDTNSQNVTFASALGGTDSVAKIGAGTLTLSAANTYSGTTTINGGTLALSGSGTLGAGTGALALGGGTLDLGGASQTVGAVTITAAPATGNTIQNGSLTGTSYAASNTTGTAVVSANLLGTGALTKTGAGTLTLSGTNSYSGTSTVSAGVLEFATEASLYNGNPASWTAANLIASGGTLAFGVGGTGGFTTGDVTTLLTNLDNAVNNNGLRNGSAIGFDTTNAAGGTFTVGNSIGNTTGTGGGAVGVTKLGAGTLVLSGASIFTGATTVLAGTLDVANALALQNSTLTLSGAGGVTFDSAVTGNAFTVGGLGGNPGIVLQNNAATPAPITLTVGNPINNASTLTSGVISGGGNLVLAGFSNTITLTGANTYTGTTTVTGSTLNLGGATANGSIGSGSNALALGGYANGGLLNYTTVSGTTAETQSFASTSFGAGENGVSTSTAYQTVNLGAISATGGATADINPNTTSAITTTNGNVNGILGGFATYGGKTTWAVAPATAGGAITGLANGAYTETGTALNVPANYAAQNIDVNASATPTGAINPNSLRFNTNTGYTLTLTGVNTIQSGGILQTATASNGGTITGGTLTGTAGGQLAITNGSGSATLNINSLIVDNGTPTAVAASGLASGGYIGFGNANNSFSGGLYFNGGRLNYASGGTPFGTGNVTFGNQIYTNAGGGGINGGGNTITSGLLVDAQGTNSSNGDISSSGGTAVWNLIGTPTSTASFAGIIGNYAGGRTVNFTLDSGTEIIANTEIGSAYLAVNGGTFQVGNGYVGAYSNSANSVALNVGGGTFVEYGNLAGTTSQAFNSGLVVKAGGSTVTALNNSGAGTLVSFAGAGSRAAGGTVNFVLPGGVQSATNGFTTVNLNTNGILGGYATVGGTDWATNATNVSGGNIIGLSNSAINSYAISSAITTAPGATANVDFQASNMTAYATQSINSLRFNTAAANTLTVADSNTLTVSSGGILETANVGNNATAITGGTLTGSATDLVVIQNNAANTLTINSIISGTGLTKSGAGALILSPQNGGGFPVNNTFTGGVYLNGGILNTNSYGIAGAGSFTFNGGTLQAASTLTSSKAVTIGATGGTIDTNGNAVTLSGAVTGTIAGAGAQGGFVSTGVFALTVNDSTGGGVLTLSGANSSFNGGIIANNGTVQAGSTTGLGTGYVTFGSTSGSTPTLDVNGFSPTFAGLIGSGTNGTVTNSSATAATLTLNGVTNQTFAGTIMDGASKLGLTVALNSPNEAQTLTGANTYSGATAVNVGTLLVNGSLTPATPGAGTAVTVGVGSTVGGTLGGTGMLTVSAVTVNTGGTLAPGAARGATTGTLTLNTTAGLTLNGTLQIAISATGGTTLATNGMLTLGGTAVLNVAGTPGASAYDIANYGTESGTFASLTGLPAGYTINYTGTTFNPAGDIELDMTPVPEPSTWAALLLGTAAWQYRRRSRRRAA